MGKATEELAPYREQIVDLTPATGDMADTAAQVAQLDLVISVDTSVAHLTGALARPVWVLLSINSDWRWLLTCEDNPWYPTARLFRQSNAGDWSDVVERVACALTKLTEQKAK